MRTRLEYLGHPETFNDNEENELIKECIKQIKEFPEFYKEYDEAIGDYFLMLNMKCIVQYENRHNIKLTW